MDGEPLKMLEEELIERVRIVGVAEGFEVEFLRWILVGLGHGLQCLGLSERAGVARNVNRNFSKDSRRR